MSAPTAEQLAARVHELQQALEEQHERARYLEQNRDAVFRTTAKLPSFWADKPAVWFSQAEAQFAIAGITQEATKYSHVVSQLDTRVAAEVEDILTGPEEGRTYTNLKETLINRLSVSEERRVKQLISEEEIGDRKPSQFLRHLRSLAGTAHVSDKLLRQIWLQRLPSSVSAILTSQSTLDLVALADLADRILEVAPAPVPAVLAVQSTQPPPPDSANPWYARLSELSAQVAALVSLNKTNQDRRSRSRTRSESRPRSYSRPPLRSSSPSHNNEVCWYHARYGADARKCANPCAFKGNANGNLS